MDELDMDTTETKCRVCHHPTHEGRCQDADDLGLPWDRPCDCEGPAEGGESSSAEERGKRGDGLAVEVIDSGVQPVTRRPCLHGGNYIDPGIER